MPPEKSGGILFYLELKELSVIIQVVKKGDRMLNNPSLYSPYASQQFQPTASFANTGFQQSPINGLITLEGGINAVESYQMPAGSVSPPLFIDEKHFCIKSFDATGGSTTELYEAKKVPLSSLEDPREAKVTKADLDAFKAEIMEAINGKHTVAEIPAAE